MDGTSFIIGILLKAGVDVNSKGPEAITSLYLAARCGYVDAVDMLLHYGAQVNDSYKGVTPLLRAICEDQNVLAQVLIDAGAGVESGDNYGTTLFSPDAQSLLKAHGFDYRTFSQTFQKGKKLLEKRRQEEILLRSKDCPMLLKDIMALVVDYYFCVDTQTFLSLQPKSFGYLVKFFSFFGSIQYDSTFYNRQK